MKSLFFPEMHSFESREFAFGVFFSSLIDLVQKRSKWKMLNEWVRTNKIWIHHDTCFIPGGKHDDEP